MARDVDPTAGSLRGVNSYWQRLNDEDIARGRHRDRVGGYWDELGALQLRLLQQHGLQPEHSLLDLGCGALRGGVHFVRYLQPGRYCGIDANTSLIEAGRRELDEAGLSGKRARLVANADFALNVFGCRFDYVVALSVFTHLYLNHIQLALCRVRDVMTPRGRFLVSFFEAPTAACIEEMVVPPANVVTYFERDPFHQSFDELAKMAVHAGLRAELVGEFGHPRGQRLVVFSSL